MRTKIGAALVCVVGLAAGLGTAWAQSVPQLINYQGRLNNAAGLPVNTPVAMHFALLDGDSVSANVLWGETQNTVPVSQGLYNVLLGSVTPLPAPVFNRQPLFLEVRVNGETLRPRTRITSVAYAQNAQMLGGRDAGEYAAYRRTIVVSPEPGDASASGDLLLAALASITDASQYNRYLLKIEPGWYYLNTASLQMKPYVDIEGSGEKTTVIYSDVSFSDTICNGTVNLADEAELRFLTAQNSLYENPASATAICAGGVTSAKLLHVTAVAGGNYSGTYYGVYNHHGASYEMEDVEVRATAWGADCVGVFNFQNSSPDMENVKVTVSHNLGVGDYVGVHNSESSSPTMNNLQVTVENGQSNVGIKNDTESFETVSSPKLSNSFVEVSSSDPLTLENISISNIYSIPLISDCIFYATGGADASQIGMYNYLSPPSFGLYSPPSWKNIYMKISGGDNSTNTGMKNMRSRITLENSRIDVTSSDVGGLGYGTYNDDAGYGAVYFQLSGSVINVIGGDTQGFNPVAVYNHHNCIVSISFSTLMASPFSEQQKSIVIYQDNNGRSTWIDHSILKGNYYLYGPSSWLIYIGSSQLDGHFHLDVGTVKCTLCYNGQYVSGLYPSISWDPVWHEIVADYCPENEPW